MLKVFALMAPSALFAEVCSPQPRRQRGGMRVIHARLSYG
jgi:hypothetical protein